MDGASGAGTPQLEVRLLGPIEADRGGEPVTLGGPKPRALLAMLALDPGRVVSVDGLVEALWPGDPPETAAHAVQVYVSQLRKALGPVIATRPPGYEVEVDPDRVDVHRFARLAQEGRAALVGGDPVAGEGALREALALWRGPALADFLYEPFAQTEIARLEELRTAVLEDRIDADLALGRHAELVSELEALVQAQPLRERPRGQLMLALYRSGRQADALAAYRAARETLVEELGIDPGPDLRELEAAILRQDDALLLEETRVARPPMQFRRLATILFCDIVDSMGIAELLDAEALGVVQRRYFETVSAAIQRHGGAVEKYAGDAVMAAFGIPISHEDDALRAARAALEARAGVAALAEELARVHGLELEVRIGLAAGEVVAAATEARQRFVAGDAVGVAARLEQSAEPGEIVVGDIVARLIDHAARLEPLGMLEAKSRKAPVQMFRLVELEPVAPAFERRLDAALVGRKRELAALRRSLKRAVDGSTARVAIVTAPPGVGKSRLVSEFTRRAKGITVLAGRCLSYGDGITYWPLREIIAAAPESDERAAILDGLEGETPPPAPELALLFRRFCEATAREVPLVLVLDDIHWAEPTLLELVEHLADKGESSILVVCVAREELAEAHPGFLAERRNVDRVELGALSAEEADALLDGLGGGVLESDQRARVIASAEGNPLFLEQLLALALEGGLTESRVPETIQALLAARLDRLGPGERAVLERGAVVGKEFSGDDVIALLDPDAVATAQSHLDSLVARGFIRPRGDSRFAFRHVLLQDAVYRAAPKRLRAELHEKFADRLDDTAPDLPELDEFAGYHLERAYRLRTELGESDRHAHRLAEDAGRRLGDAGYRAMKRGDVHAGDTLLRRAIALLPAGTARSALLCELGIVLNGAGRPDEAIAVLEGVIGHAEASADRVVELRARLELEYVRIPRTSGADGESLLDVAALAIPAFEAAGNERWLGRALLLTGWIHGGRRGQHALRLELAERALVLYDRASWPTSTPAGEVANALYYGPTPVPDAIERCRTLLEEESRDRYGRANIEVFLGGLVAQAGDFAEADALIASARATYEEFGHLATIAMTSSAVRGDVELLAGESADAEATLRPHCHDLQRSGAFSHLASRAGDLAEALYRQGAFDEADDWVALARRHSSADDLDARIIWMPVLGKLAARRGQIEEAIAIATEAAGLAETTDGLNRRAIVQVDLGEVLQVAGRQPDATTALEHAEELFVAKGNVVGANRARALRDRVVLV